MNATDVLKYGQLTVIEAIDGFPEMAWETPGACGAWSVKDIIAHLAAGIQDVERFAQTSGHLPYAEGYAKSYGVFRCFVESARLLKSTLTWNDIFLMKNNLCCCFMRSLMVMEVSSLLSLPEGLHVESCIPTLRQRASSTSSNSSKDKAMVGRAFPCAVSVCFMRCRSGARVAKLFCEGVGESRIYRKNSCCSMR